MGQSYHRRIVVLVIVFSITSLLIYQTPPSTPVAKKASLVNSLNIEGWKSGEPVPLHSKILKALEVHDYVNQYYSRGKDRVFLYVGYYLSTEKVGAPHSPLVCFHGAGWTISKTENISTDLGGHKLHFVSAIVTRSKERQLLLYWFQAFDKTFQGTFFQKLYAFWTKWLHGREDTAFVRISLPLGEEVPPVVAMRTGMAFLGAFYPIFLEYVVSAEH